jgi:hypothetical protein
MFGRESFNGQQIVRSLYGDGASVQSWVRTKPGLAAVSHFLVIVNNTTMYGGMMAGGVGWTSKAGGSWPAVAVHELAHQAFGLADEYPYRNDENDPVRAYVGSEPSAPNVTTVTTIATLKWGGLVRLPPTLVPTTRKTTPCARDHSVISAVPPVPPGAVGAYEGAQYFDCDIYRPSLNCKMREQTHAFLQRTASSNPAWSAIISFRLGKTGPRPWAKGRP